MVGAGDPLQIGCVGRQTHGFCSVRPVSLCLWIAIYGCSLTSLIRGATGAADETMWWCLDRVVDSAPRIIDGLCRGAADVD